MEKKRHSIWLYSSMFQLIQDRRSIPFSLHGSTRSNENKMSWLTRTRLHILHLQDSPFLGFAGAVRQHACKLPEGHPKLLLRARCLTNVASWKTDRRTTKEKLFANNNNNFSHFFQGGLGFGLAGRHRFIILCPTRWRGPACVSGSQIPPSFGGFSDSFKMITRRMYSATCWSPLHELQIFDEMSFYSQIGENWLLLSYC